MILVEMNKDIRQYKAKLLGPFSGREVICLVLGVGFVWFVEFVLLAGVDMTLDVQSFLALGLMLPFVGIGWGKIYGMHIEQFIKTTFITFIAPKTRKYDNGLKVERKQIKTKRSKNKDLQPFK
jgi:hypothetical protein